MYKLTTPCKESY